MMRYGRLLLITLLGVLLVCMAGTIAFAAFTLSCDPTSATANSVWNFKAVWTDSNGNWPNATAPRTDGLVNYSNEGTTTIGSVRPTTPDEPEDSDTFWPQLNAPDGFAGFADPSDSLSSNEVWNELNYVSVQPNPGTAQELETDSKSVLYDHGMNYIADESGSMPDATTPLTDVPSTANADGSLQAMVIPAAGESTDPNDGSAIPATPAVIVPQHNPLWIVGVWTDAEHKKPIQARIVKASSLYSKWPNYNVIEIVKSSDVPTGTVLYYSYYCPGVNYVATKKYPLAMPYTVYKIKVTTSNATNIKINDAIVNFDKYYRTADPSDPAASIDQSPIMGLYKYPALSAAQVAGDADAGYNYFTMGNYCPPGTDLPPYGTHNDYGIITFPTDKALNVSKDSFLYLQVSTHAVLGVWDNLNGTGTNYYHNASDQPLGYCSKSGIIRLGTQLSDGLLVKDATAGGAIVKGPQVWVTYKPLDSTSYSIGQGGQLGAVVDFANVTPADDEFSYNCENVVLSGANFTFKEGTAPSSDTYACSIKYSLKTPGMEDHGTVYLNGSIPMQYEKGAPKDGAIFRVAVSAGLNMSNSKQWPSDDVVTNKPIYNNKLIYDPRSWPMYYVSGLIAGDSGTAIARELSAVAYSYNSCAVETSTVDSYSVTVHDSCAGSDMVNYGGVVGDRDWLSCYPEGPAGGFWPWEPDIDPLTVEPSREVNSTYPDDGSSSTQFIFRVRYHNKDGLSPKPWFNGGEVYWDYRLDNSESGVVLYLDEKGDGNYKPHFMRRESPNDTSLVVAGADTGDVYIYRCIPHNQLKFIADDGLIFPFPYSPYADNQLYQSLACGTYHYFFACSDDSLQFENESYPFQHQSLDGLAEWGETYGSSYYDVSTGLDPSLPRVVTGYEEVSRSEKRKYSSNGTDCFDYTIYVDRPVRAPGLFEEDYLKESGMMYKYPASEHPKITCSLGMPAYDDIGIRYDDVSYGNGRIFGTLTPLKSAVNPTMAGARGTGQAAVLAETCGATASTTNVFRILYSQIDNKAPSYVKLYINNANEKTGSDSAHTYTAYEMAERSDQTLPYNYASGVWYETKIKLPVGPHTYYFQAYDGYHVARFPVRPDYYSYGSGAITDWWVPTSSQASEYGTSTYVDNDYIPGPYVNNAPTISDITVTPGTGKEGQNFKYRAKYTDPDGQRPYSTNVIIETGTNKTRTYSMVSEVEIDPTADNTSLFKNGVYYYMDSSLINDFALEPGTRRFKIEFTDDWGRQDDSNDYRKGETVTSPWQEGPVVSLNTVPRLNNGSIESPDGTANAATLWTFSVDYYDADNDAPSLIKLYLGEVQADGKNIFWDDGHTMSPSNSTNTVYSTGVNYYYQTRLNGPDALNPKRQYYYAFEAYDGIDYATYKTSEYADEKSDSAGCYLLENLVATSDPLKFSIVTKTVMTINVAAATSSITLTSDQANNIIRIWGVYDNASLQGTNYLGNTDPYEFDSNNPTINLTQQIPAGNAWMQYEAQSPIIGPLSDESSTGAGVLTDAEIYQDFSTDATPLNVNDQKNGRWNSGSDHAIARMLGTAQYLGTASDTRVTPYDSSVIASVEKVQLLDEYQAMGSDLAPNYYDRSKLCSPWEAGDMIRKGTYGVVRTGTVIAIDGSNNLIIQPDNPDEIVSVLGIYDSYACTGTNYYLGEGYPETTTAAGLKWQKAYVSSSSTIVPVDPVNIVGINGVYTNTSIDPVVNYLTPMVELATQFSTDDPATTDIEQETITLTQNVDADNVSQLYVAYYGPGTLDSSNQITTTSNIASASIGSTVYLRVLVHGFNPGDSYVALTDELPAKTMTGTQVTGSRIAVIPQNASDIGLVTKVTVDGGDTDYYTGTRNTFNPGDTQIILGSVLPVTVGTITVYYLPKTRPVVIEYSDMRFTHMLRGIASNLSGFSNGNPQYTTSGSTYYSPDGWRTGVRINGNWPNSAIIPTDSSFIDPTELDAGMIGVWLDSDNSGTNYFNPRWINRYNNNADHIRLSEDAPDGIGVLYARFYQYGDYNIDRWSHVVTFRDQPTDVSKLQASYFFGTKMPYTINENSLPELSNGSVSPIKGSKGGKYVYTITYKDTDGPNGQAPAYVRVYIDGVAYDMTSTSTGTPTYNTGATYTYTASSALGSGSHTYHFLASDGAAVAWYDANGGKNSSTVATDLVDLKGPWVNDPPVLSAGSTTPSGQITTSDSIDYYVTLTDADNDIPYVFNSVTDTTGDLTIAQSVSGAPRLWIDAAGMLDTATPITGTISDILIDPLGEGQKRVIVAANQSRTWETNEFAGDMLQITNSNAATGYSSPYLRVFLIQSNTKNTLTLATDDLATSGVVAGNTFRINGLLMSKQDSTQQDFTAGIVYKLTVPRMAVGAHTYHFTARTRETKPDWLLALNTYTNKARYSDLARYPISSSSELSGPTVIATTPTNNTAPVLSALSTGTLYRGPKPQYATVATTTTVTPSDYNVLNTVLGVYVNANIDAHLSTATNYFDLASTNPPATGDTVKLATSLPAIADTDELIQHGVADSTLSVIPDVASAIGEVEGVYLFSDSTFSGTEYIPVSSTLSSGKIILPTGSELPSDTTDVYIKYTPATTTMTTTDNGSGSITLDNPDTIAYVVGAYWATDTAMQNNLVDPSSFTPGESSIAMTVAPNSGAGIVIKYVPWPPMYIEYYAVAPSNSIYLAGESLTFKAVYTDVDGDPPAYHDGVQGYVKVVFDDTGVSSQMTTSDITSYTSGRTFEITLDNVAQGTHKYHFEASDGYQTARYPASVTNDPSIKINYKPVLSNAAVDHIIGASTFTFSVKYTDLDGTAPQYIKVILTDQSDSMKQYSIDMSTSVSSPNYKTGVAYTAVAGQTTTLDPGTYDVKIIANDSIQDAVPVSTSEGYIYVRDGNAAPQIVDYEVKKLLSNGELGSGAGKTTDTFVYRAWYKDDDNDAPVANISGVKYAGLTLIIDKDTSIQQTYLMTVKTATTDYQVAEGVEYRVSVLGKKLGAGNHTYTVIASDGTDNATFADGVLSIKSGPVLMIPYFDLSIIGKDGTVISDQSLVGQETLIEGQMLFPYIADQQPSSISNITIQVTKPDSTAITMTASLSNIRANSSTNPTNWVGDIVVNYSGYVDSSLTTGTSLTLSASGDWVINAIWTGNTTWDGAETDSTIDGYNDELEVTVGGPIRTIATADPLNPDTSAPVADMITPPMIIGSSSPSNIFGADRALQMQIVRWDPSSRLYLRYTSSGIFPGLNSGEAVWIKPKVATTTTSGYPSAEPLGKESMKSVSTSSLTNVPINWYASCIYGVYTSESTTGTNYYVPSQALISFKSGDDTLNLTTTLPTGTNTVYVDYVGEQNGVDQGWITLDNPSIATAIVNGDPRYYKTKYKQIKVQAQSYTYQTNDSGTVIVDTDTQLPKLEACTISLGAGWNQIGNIFFNWRKATQLGTPNTVSGSPDYTKVIPVQSSIIGKVLGVYLNSSLTGTNYYQPGIATDPFTYGDSVINLTKTLPTGTASVYIKYEFYPREDLGIPINELQVTYLGTTKSLAAAKTAGWICDYAWRYDSQQRAYVKVSSTLSGAEKVLKAWSGYWILAYVNCQLIIDPNTTYNGTISSVSTMEVGGTRDLDTLEMPPPAP